MRVKFEKRIFNKYEYFAESWDGKLRRGNSTIEFTENANLNSMNQR